MVPLYYAAKSNIYTLLQMWVWAYRNAMLTLIVNTNNGVESQNKVFKHDYLAPYRVKSISGLLGVLIEDYFVYARRE
jgi:hypothetical protein